MLQTAGLCYIYYRSPCPFRSCRFVICFAEHLQRPNLIVWVCDRPWWKEVGGSVYEQQDTVCVCGVGLEWYQGYSRYAVGLLFNKHTPTHQTRLFLASRCWQQSDSRRQLGKHRSYCPQSVCVRACMYVRALYLIEQLQQCVMCTLSVFTLTSGCTEVSECRVEIICARAVVFWSTAHEKCIRLWRV